MTGTARAELFPAEIFLKKGEYKDALKVVETFAAREGLPVDDRLACSLLENHLRVKLGELEKAFILVEEILQTARERKTLLLVVDALIIKAEAFWHSGKLDKGLEAVEEGEELLAEAELEYIEGREGEIKQRKGDSLTCTILLNSHFILFTPE